MERLDNYDIKPAGYEAYLSHHGHHFSKRLCEWAVSRMRDRNDKKVTMRSYDKVDEILRSYGVEIKNDNGYDKVFVMHMALSDYYGSSITDEALVAKYVKDVLDDIDGYLGIAFYRFLADCTGKGVSISWEDMV